MKTDWKDNGFQMLCPIHERMYECNEKLTFVSSMKAKQKESMLRNDSKIESSKRKSNSMIGTDDSIDDKFHESKRIKLDDEKDESLSICDR